MTPLMSIVARAVDDLAPVRVPMVVPAPVFATQERPKIVDLTVTRAPLETTVPFVVPAMFLTSSSPLARTVVVWLQPVKVRLEILPFGFEDGVTLSILPLTSEPVHVSLTPPSVSWSRAEVPLLRVETISVPVPRAVEPLRRVD